jgi:hypothetical protein
MARTPNGSAVICALKSTDTGSQHGHDHKNARYRQHFGQKITKQGEK